MKRSNCCSYPIVGETGICGMCGEHCEEKEDEVFYIVKWDTGLMCEPGTTIDDLEVIKTLDSDIEFESKLLRIDNKFYRKCSRNFKLNYLSVEECDEPQYEDELHCEDEITCPNCGYKISDSWECSDSGDKACSSCGSEYSYQRNVMVDYSMTVTKSNKTIVDL